MKDLGDFEDFKVLTVAATGIIFSYLKIDALNGLRYIVLLATLAFTLYKFYHEIKKNNKRK